MKCSFAVLPLSVVLSISVAIAQAAPTVPFTEHFATDAANWRNGANVALDYSASGGPDASGYATVTTPIGNPTVNDSNLILFRGQNNFDSSNHQFEGDWISGGINRFSAYVRHNAPNPLEYFVRFTTPMNFPGIAAIPPTTVPPNVWTKLAFNISPSNGNIELFPEGAPSAFLGQFSQIFGNLGRIQIGITLPPQTPTSGPYKFDVDQVSINIPEPASALLMLVVFSTLATCRRRA